MRRGSNDCGEVGVEKDGGGNDDGPGGRLCPEQGRIGFGLEERGDQLDFARSS